MSVSVCPQADVYTLPAEQTVLQVPALLEGGVYCVRAQAVFGTELQSGSTDAHCVSITGTDVLANMHTYICTSYHGNSFTDMTGLTFPKYPNLKYSQSQSMPSLQKSTHIALFLHNVVTQRKMLPLS